MNHTHMAPRSIAGFTLVEITIVLLIVALLLGGLLPTISGQVEQRRTSETIKKLEEIKEALIGYAIINGRLPCPATAIPNTNGAESFAGGGDANNGICRDFNAGFVPSATLGLPGTDSSGFAVDAWGNRIRYAVTSWNYVFTSVNGMSTAWATGLSPNLLVCSNSTATGFSGSSCGTDNALTSSPGVPVVIFSTGNNGGQGGAGLDELANINGDRVFVSHTNAPDFDDLVIWLSPNTLVNRMVAAGRLP